MKFWCVSELDNLEVLHATNILSSSSRHTHETLAVGIIEQGTASLKHKGEPYSISAGCVVAINPDDAHACQSENSLGYSQRMMYLSVALLEQATYELTGRSGIIPLFTEPVLRDKLLMQQVGRLFLLLEASSCVLELETQLFWTLISLIRTGAKIPPTQIQQVNCGGKQIVCQIREYLEANYAENLSLSQLASLVHLSPFHLSRVFCHAIGLPPHLYLTQVRVLQAKKLLAQGWAIAQVAQEVGFSHQSHLNRHFKKIVGITPKQYQNSKNVQD